MKVEGRDVMQNFKGVRNLFGNQEHDEDAVIPEGDDDEESKALVPNPNQSCFPDIKVYSIWPWVEFFLQAIKAGVLVLIDGMVAKTLVLVFLLVCNVDADFLAAV